MGGQVWYTIIVNFFYLPLFFRFIFLVVFAVIFLRFSFWQAFAILLPLKRWICVRCKRRLACADIPIYVCGKVCMCVYK